jgi:diguanylate cyclase (GGDEF)-like protein/PAS domain S-box-containing protein
LQECAQAIVRHLDAALVRIWTLNREESILELQASAGIYTHLDGQYARVPVGHLDIGLIVQELKPLSTNAIIGNPLIADQEWVRREGVVAFTGYPLVVEDRAVGVIALFARHPLPGDTLRTLGAIADSIALGVRRQRAEHALREREERLSRIVETNADGIILQDLNDRFTFANSAAEKMFALPRSEIIGRTSEELGQKLFSLNGSPLPDEDHPSARTAAAVNPIYDAEYILERHDGRRLIVSSNSAPLYDPDGRIIGSVNSIVDITERKRNEQALLRSEEEFRLLFADNPLPMWVYDPDTLRFLEVNAAAVDHYGYSRAEFLQMRITDIRPPEDVPQLLKCVKGVRGALRRSGEWRHQLKDERVIYVDIRSHVLEFAGHEAVLVLALDITERKTFEEQLKHQALHDTLTHLPNRALLNDRLEQAMHQAERHVKKTALILMDLDRFKEINDTLGHHYGDILLQQLSLRLLKTLRSSDTVARLGGDEFAMVLPETEYEGALRAITSIQAALKAPFLVEGEYLGIAASFGIALYSGHGEDAATLLRHADVAMYVAKRDHSGYALYEPGQDEHSLRRLTVVSELARAIEGEQLFVQYQPQYTVKSGSIDRVEALVRWRHPVRGLISPGEFIPWAEETGQIRHLTLWVLRTAIEQCRVWHDAGSLLGVAVNFSTRNLLDRSLVATIAELMRTSDVFTGRLSLEITESALMADPARAREILTEIHDMGVRISIDDFGTGYSSLASLGRMPLDEMKIDRSLIVDMNGTVGDPFIVRSIIDLGHHLGLEVVAEGVEDHETYQALADLGCDTIQGYYIARPLAAADVLACLPPKSVVAEVRHSG